MRLAFFSAQINLFRFLQRHRTAFLLPAAAAGYPQNRGFAPAPLP